MKEKLDLSQIRLKELELLKYFDLFCQENGLKYYLSNGTLLGAVKYQGFIPWDDDVDVIMPRQDYDLLVSTYIDSKYILYDYNRCKDYLYPFAKLSDSETVLEEFGVNNGVKLGVNIDVFPIDNIGDDYKNAKKYASYMHFLSMLLIFSKKKIEYNPSISLIKNLLYCSVGIICKCVNSKKYIELIQKKSIQHNGKKSKYVGSLCWSVYKEKEAIPVDVFNSSVNLLFEGNYYPAPIGYDVYLRSLYGDYHQDPPKDKQVTHHHFVAYKKQM